MQQHPKRCSPQELQKFCKTILQAQAGPEGTVKFSLSENLVLPQSKSTLNLH